MDQDDKTFTPETVDEQVDHLLTSSPTDLKDTPAQVVHMLRDMYEDTVRVQRVWERLASHIAEAQRRTCMMPTLPLQGEREVRPEERNKQMHIHQPLTSLSHRLKGPFRLLAASLVLALLVGSLITILQIAHSTQGLQTQGSQPAITARVVYREQLTATSISTPAWSANSQQLAVQGKPTIWDALTGKHSLTISPSDAYAAAPVWSPTGNLLALPGETSVAVVNGQNGQVVATYHMSGLPYSALASSGGPLAAHVPLAGVAITGISWSPDGTAIVSCSSFGLVQIWHAQTGQPTATLSQLTNGQGCIGVAWSYNGKYIAICTPAQVIVWSVQAQKSVFQVSAVQEQFFTGVSWQPVSDNLAVTLVGTGGVEVSSTPTPTPAGSTPTPTPTPAPTGSTPVPTPTSQSKSPDARFLAVQPLAKPLAVAASNQGMLRIWNVASGQLQQSIAGVDGNVTWSPDGKEIAYTNQLDSNAPMTMTILDIATKQSIYSYHAPSTQVELSDPAWSPDGLYLAIMVTEPAAATPTPVATTTTSSSTYPYAFQVQVWMI
jgi:WD40 repeat protein